MFGRFDFSKGKYGKPLLIDLMRLENLGPYLARKPIHRLSYFDITLITGGKGVFSIDGRKTAIARGRVFPTAPGQVRQWLCDAPPRGYALIFEEEFLAAFFRDARFASRLPLFDDHAPADILLTSGEQARLAPFFLDIETEIQRGESRDEHYLRALLYTILTILNRKPVTGRADDRQAASQGHAAKFFQAVDAGYLENRSVEFYARLLCISSGHLNDLVKDSVGTSAKRHIQARVFLEAKRMLLYSDGTIDEIAARLRFKSASYFIKAFRADTGRTPLAFRRQKNP
ncbi:MAG: helix-turn-helix domain-containing protein [Fibrobacteria bacterium]